MIAQHTSRNEHEALLRNGTLLGYLPTLVGPPL